jgi:hypothetical protein
MACVPRENMRSVHATGIAGHPTVNRRVTGAIVRLFRPLLKVNMVAYRLEMTSGLFPSDSPEGEVVGTDACRMLFIGDTAASGYGVLNHGLAVVSQTARYVAREHRIGCSWSAISDPVLIMSRATSEVAKTTTNVDIVVVVLGVPDVLLGTTVTEWTAQLRQLIATVREGASSECQVVVAGIPPMYRFRTMPRFLQRILALQIQRLNRGSRQVAHSVPGVSYCPFPRLEPSTAFILDSFDWRTLHSRWGQQLGAAAALALSTRRAQADGAPPLDD